SVPRPVASSLSALSSPAALPILPLLVIWSLGEVPLSVASDRLGAPGAVLSRVKLKVLEFDETLPALSACRTITLLAPSPLSVKLDPLPTRQHAPPSPLSYPASPF